MKNFKRNINVLLIIFNIALLLGLLLVQWIARGNPWLVENIYSRGVYIFFIKVFTWPNRLVGLPVSQIIIGIWVFILMSVLYHLIKNLFHKKFKQSLTCFLLIITFIVSGITHMQISWGLNNYRYSILKNLEISEQEVSIEDLKALYIYLATKANEEREELDYDLYTRKEIYDNAYIGYKNLHMEYPFINGDHVRVKPLIISDFFSSAGYTGIFLYMAYEPTVNHMPPIYTIPFTALHEIAHQKGFSSEDEANFLAFLTGVRHDEAIYRYSSYYSAMEYVGNAIYRNDKELYFEVAKYKSELVNADVQNEIQFWKKNIVEKNREVMNDVNDQYLKASNQPEGILNYSKVVELLVQAYLSDSIDF